MRRHLALSLLLALGCGQSSASTQSEEADGAQKVKAPEVAPDPVAEAAAAKPTPEAPSAPAAAAAKTLDDACSNAALGLPSGTVIATVDGEPIRAEAMGDDARQAERDALHTYCREVHRIREATSRRAIDDHLLAKAAREAGIGTDQYVSQQLDAKVTRPDDGEIEAFYEANKTEQAPPLELVKGQVEEAIVKERSKKAYDELLASLRKKAEVELKLPDVRPPPVELAPAEHSATFGPKDAKLTIVEFSDFECPYCSRAADGVNAVKQRFGDQVQVVYRHFPLSFHPAAKPAAEISQCAHEQGKFWAVHDEIFASKEKLGPESLRVAAQNAGVDMAKLDECLGSGRASQQVEADMAKAREVGVRGTPAFYFNGRTYEGGTSPDEMVAAVEAELRGS